MDEVVEQSHGDTASIADTTRAVFAELSEASPASTETPTETAQPSTPASATAPQAANPFQPETPTAVPAGEPPAPGPIPPERHKAILESERAKRVELEARVQALAPVEAMHARFNEDPIEFYLQLGQELSQHPELGADPRLRSSAARTLAARRPTVAPPEPVADDAMPEVVPLRDTNGNEVFAAEDVKRLLQWTEQRVLGRMQQTIAPIQQEREAEKQLQQAHATVTRVKTDASKLLAEARKSPGWTEQNEPQIKQRFAALVKAGTKPEAAIWQAYRDVVVPTLQRAERQAVVSSLQTKTEAKTISPSGPITAPGKAGPVNVRDLVKQAFAEASA